jgi:hypothetical protein
MRGLCVRLRHPRQGCPGQLRRRETNPIPPYWQPNRGCTAFEIRKTNPRSAKLAAHCGARGPAAVAKRTQWAPLRRRNLRNEPMRSAERSGKRANEPAEPAAWRPDRANEPTVGAVARMAPIGGIASSPRRTESGANRLNIATMIGQEGIAAIGGIVPASGDKVGVARAGRRSAHSGGWDRGTCAQRPRHTGWPGSRRGPGDGSEGGRHGAQDARRRPGWAVPAVSGPPRRPRPGGRSGVAA